MLRIRSPGSALIDHLRRLLPSPDAVRANRWLQWLGPALHHPRLWHVSRRGIALGVALGMFFGFLVPIAQIPLSAAAAVLLRANVPCAIASTLVTNPVTFGPVYVAAWKVGGLALGSRTPPPPLPTLDDPEAYTPALSWGERIAGVGKPLIVGLVIFAVVAFGAAYLLVTGFWWARTRLARRRRLKMRRAREAG